MEQRATLLPGAEYVALRESLTRPVKRMQGISGKMTLSFKSVIWKGIVLVISIIVRLYFRFFGKWSIFMAW